MQSNPNSQRDLSKVRRNRTPLSCTICRKRRLKCDKQRPFCFNCSQLNIAHLCHYMKQPWVDDNDNLSENDENYFLKRKLDNLNRLIDLSTTLNTHQWLVRRNNQNFFYHSSELTINLASHLSNIDYDENYIENTFKYNPLNNPIAILRSEPILSGIWDSIINSNETKENLNSPLDNSITFKTGNTDSIVLLEAPSDKKEQSSNTAYLRRNNNDSHLNSSSKIDLETNSSDHEVSTFYNKTGNKLVKSQKKNSCLSQNMYPTSGKIEIQKLKEIDQNVGNQTISPDEHLPDRERTDTQHAAKNDEHLKGRISIVNLLNMERKEKSDQNFEHNKSIDPQYVIDVNSDADLNQNTIESANATLDELIISANPTKEQILNEVLAILPSRLETELTIQMFVKYIYPGIPFLDSKNLRIQLYKIFPYVDTTVGLLQPDNKFPKLTLSNYNDYCNLGVIILVIKLTELSFSKIGYNRDSLNDSKVENSKFERNSELFKHDIPHSIIVLIEMYFIKIRENLTDAYVPLPLIHFTILCNIYMECCNKIDDRFNALCSVENIIELALSFGLNIDPNNHPLLNGSRNKNNRDNLPLNIERYKHTWRKTWYFVVSLDVTKSLNLGRTRLLKNLRERSNTKLPIFSNIDYVKNIQELIIVKNFTLFYEIDLIIISVLNLFENARPHNLTKLKFDVLMTCLIDFLYGKSSAKETLLTLDNLNVLPIQEILLRLYYIEEANEHYNLPDIDILLHVKSKVLNLTELEKKLELPGTSMVNPNFVLKHTLLKHLIFKVHWKSFLLFDNSLHDNEVGNFYAIEALKWAKDILNNILLFFDETLKDFALAETLLTPSLLHPLFSSVQYLTSLALKNYSILDNVSFMLLDSITRLLEKISRHNGRSSLILEYIKNFNEIFQRAKRSLDRTTSDLIQNVPSVVSQFQSCAQQKDTSQSYMVPHLVPFNSEIQPSPVAYFQPNTVGTNNLDTYVLPQEPVNNFPITNQPFYRAPYMNNGMVMIRQSQSSSPLQQQMPFDNLIYAQQQMQQINPYVNIPTQHSMSYVPPQTKMRSAPPVQYPVRKNNMHVHNPVNLQERKHFPRENG